jgi:hypothetical protein
VVLSPGPRKLALTAHVASSVGWFGAVAGFLVLALTGLNSDDGQLVGGVYRAADVVVRSAIVPLAFMSVVTGVVQGLGTRWGLFRHYWVVIKLIITVVATLVLLSELGPIGDLADSARAGKLEGDAMRAERTSLVVHSGGGLLTLLVPMVLSIYKPRGLTRYGRRKEGRRFDTDADERTEYP